MYIYLLIGILLYLYLVKCESFVDSAGTFYNQVSYAGVARSLPLGVKIILHDGDWKIWSCSTVNTIKVTGGSGVLYIRGKIDNLPAALGGLPASKNYALIFASPIVYAEFIDFEIAKLEIANLLGKCMQSTSEKICKTEFYNL